MAYIKFNATLNKVHWDINCSPCWVVKSRPLGHLYTRAWGSVTTESKILHWWRMPRPSHFAWGLKGPRRLEWMKNLHGALHGIQCKILHGLPDFTWSLPQRVGPTPNLGPQHFKISQSLIHYNLLCTRAHIIEDGNEMIFSWESSHIHLYTKPEG